MKNLINIISKIVDTNELEIHEDSIEKYIEITNKSDTQTLVIQLADDGFWVRLRQPYTGYFCESTEEFEAYVEALMTHKIEVCVGLKNDEWVETIIAMDHNYEEFNEELDYTISSWKA